jgi:hypothetical protein
MVVALLAHIKLTWVLILLSAGQAGVQALGAETVGAMLHLEV